MMTFLRTNGFKVVLWFTPFMDTTSWSEGYANCLYNVTLSGGADENYSALQASNYFVHAVSGTTTSVLSVAWWKGTGSPIDFTNPNAAHWFQSTLSNLVTVSSSGGQQVIGGFKTDDGEGLASPSPFIPLNALYADGRTGVEMQNGYCVEYQKTISAVLGTNGILWGRSGFAGSQTAPAIWGGDNEPNFGNGNGLPAVMLAGEGAAMSGFSIWGSDICGYEDGPWDTSTNNLCIRWSQFGAFTPIMQWHRQVGNCLMYPWRFSADALTNYEYYTQLRASLLPYIYSYATQASTSGLPILRPLVLMYPADANTYGSVYNTSHSYMFGNEFLVAPVVTANATSRAVYLPQGHWFDFFSNQRYTGGQTITWNNANQHQMPLFVREGAVIPMISTNVQTALDSTYTSNSNLISPGNALQFLVYPTTNSNFTVYDGTSLQCQSNGTVIAATLNSVARPILLRFFVGQPAGVERNGVPLPPIANATSFAAAGLGWYYDAPSGFLQVKFNHSGGPVTIMFGPDSVGDGISDSWRSYWFGSANAAVTNGQNCASCDPDGTGQDNLFKYAAGLNPTNPASVFSTQNVGFQVTGGTNEFTVSWQTQPGIQYQVLWKNLMDPSVPWQTNATVFMGDGTVFNWVDNGSVTGTLPLNSPTGARFYKVIVP
jgi:alpha-D-xyloside xylohydrolase